MGTKELANAKASLEGAAGGYQKLKGKAIALEADKTAMKGQVTVIADAIAALDKKAAAAPVEKREMWSTISTIQSDITTSLARASYLEKEGFAVDPENVGALVKMHYKLHSYVTYKLKKGKKQITTTTTFSAGGLPGKKDTHAHLNYELWTRS